MIIKYVSGAGTLGEEVDLISYPYRMTTGNFLDYAWAYDEKNDRITGFRKGIQERGFTIRVMGRSAAEYAANWSRIHDIFERDVVNCTPGRLYFGDEYLSCYIRAAEKTKWERGRACSNAYTLVSDSPAWKRDKVRTFYIAGPGSGSYLDYPHDYEYDYASSGAAEAVSNDAVMPAHMLIRIDSPCTDPWISIGGQEYRVHTTIASGERLEIDTRAQTVRRITRQGTVVNEFNNRDKSYDIFAQLPYGSYPVLWPGSFRFTLTVVEERSEPRWT